MRESSQISPNQSFPPSRAARRFGLRFAFSNARPPLPPPRAAVCETRPNFGCIVVKPRGAGALGFASPDPTKVWDHPPRARGPSCETRPRLGKNLSLARARGADSSAFLASHILRTIQRDGRDAVGLRLALFGTLPRIRGAGGQSPRWRLRVQTAALCPLNRAAKINGFSADYPAG